MSDILQHDYFPTVIVPGIGQSKTEMLDNEGNKILTSWPLDLDMDMLKKKLLPGAARMMLLRCDAGFSKKLKSTLCEALDPLKCNPDGSQKNNIRVVSYDGSIAKCSDDERRYIKRMVPYERFTDLVGEQNVYYFAYNPFGRAYETVELLHEYIQKVKSETGRDKVNLIVISLGGTISTAYLDKYGERGDINRVVGIVPAFDGSTVLSDIFAKNFDYENYESLFINLLGNGDGGKLVSLLKKVPQKLVYKYIDTILDAAIETILINSPMMWGTLPAKKYEALRDRYISGEQYKSLREQTDKAWRVRADLPALVQRMKKVGVEIYSLCGYNVKLFAVASDRVTSDMIVDAASTTMGAACAPLGGTLGEGYVQKNCFCTGHSHISPDNTVDMSQSPIADTTWLFKNMEHEQCAQCEQLLTIAGKLISSDEIKDVFSDAKYPQFNEYVKK